MPKLKPGDQIAYVPSHAFGDIDHPDVEFGFVTSVRGDTVFCRYWTTGTIATGDPQLRTKASSEGAHKSLVVQHESTSQRNIDNTLAAIEAEMDELWSKDED